MVGGWEPSLSPRNPWAGRDARPAAPGSRRSAEDGTLRASRFRPEAPASGASDKMLRGSGGFRSGSRVARGPRPPTLPLGREGLPHLHPPPPPTSARGSGVRKSASSRAPLRTGSGRSASTSSIRSAAGSGWRRLPGSRSRRPDLGAPPPACRTPRGPPGGGGAGARPAAAARASRSGGLSGQRHLVAHAARGSGPSRRSVNQGFCNSLADCGLPGPSSNSPHPGRARSLGLEPGHRQYFSKLARWFPHTSEFENHRYR